jgi:hypothetical protein
MATLQEIRTGVKTVLEANISGLIVYDTVAGVTQVPSVVVMPRSGTMSVGMGDCVEWTFELFVLVPFTEFNLGQDALDDYIDFTAGSIPKVIKSNATLGLSGVDASVVRMSDYGGEYKSASVQHIGAQLELKVIVTQ